jgi:group I intron endonuclease
MPKYEHGVYRIVNLYDGSEYIGSCANKYGFQARFRQHLHELTRGKHFNRHLQSAWNKYGAGKFKFEILEVCDRDKAVALEQVYIDTRHPRYNISPVAGSTLGRKLSEESRARIGNSKRGVKYSYAQIAYKCKKVVDQHGTVYASISRCRKKNK